MLVLPPDFDARVAILHMGFEDRPVGGDVDLRSLAAKTEGWSGADLAALCTAAARLALRRAVLTHQPGSIGMNDLLEAHHDMRPTTDAWFDTARSVALYSNDDGLYGDLKEALGLVRRKRR
jgi:SpoVK/Ycf46/Vps4 family AAA+-type ATPase